MSDPIVSGAGGPSEAWFLFARTPGRFRGTPANWKGYLLLFGGLFGNFALIGLTVTVVVITRQFLWLIGYFLLVFPAFMFGVFALVRAKGREVPVPDGPEPVTWRIRRAFAEAQDLSYRHNGYVPSSVYRLQAIDHVQVAIPPGGEDQARPFYKDLLGLAEQPKPPELAGRGGAWFEAGAVKVHCGVEDPFNPAVKAHVAFRVNDVSGLAAQARAAGYKVVDDDPLTGFERAYIYDPFGNRLEFLRPIN